MVLRYVLCGVGKVRAGNSNETYYTYRSQNLSSAEAIVKVETFYRTCCQLAFVVEKPSRGMLTRKSVPSLLFSDELYFNALSWPLSSLVEARMVLDPRLSCLSPASTPSCARCSSAVQHLYRARNAWQLIFRTRISGEDMSSQFRFQRTALHDFQQIGDLFAALNRSIQSTKILVIRTYVCACV